jgi:hypothetical protein
LLGLVKSASAYEGWYSPTTRSTYSIRLKLPSEQIKHFSEIEVNGRKIRQQSSEGAIEMRGLGGGGSVLRWKVSRDSTL